MSRSTTSQGLHVCPSCSSHLVQPVEWEAVDDEAWSVLLQAGVYGQAELDAYDLELDRGEALLRVAYLKLSTENMAAEIDTFAHALSADAVLPEDF